MKLTRQQIETPDTCPACHANAWDDIVSLNVYYYGYVDCYMCQNCDAFLAWVDGAWETCDPNERPRTRALPRGENRGSRLARKIMEETRL